MADLHEAVFRWPHPEANDVVVTGTFDQWRQSIRLPKQGSIFEGKVKVPWGQKIAYKYIVDGRWMTTDDQPTERDLAGNVNNVYNAPAKPAVPKEEVIAAPEQVEQPQPEEEPQTAMATTTTTTTTSTTGGAIGVVSDAVSAVTETAKSAVEAIVPGTIAVATPLSAADIALTEPEPETAAEEPSVVEQTEVETVAEPVVAAEVPPHSTEVVEEPAGTTELPEASSAALPDPSPASDVSREDVLTSTPSPALAPIVPVLILPLTSEAEAYSGPVMPSTPPEADVTASKPFDTTVVEGTASAESVDAPAVVPEQEASTHGPVINRPPVTTNGTTASPTNGATTSPASPTNGVTTSPTNGIATTNGVETNGVSSHAPVETPAAASAPAPAPAASPPHSSPSSTIKRMRFPSMASRRSSQYSSSTNELGEVNGKHDAVGSLKHSERHKRHSFFGKIKSIFHHDSPAPQQKN